MRKANSDWRQALDLQLNWSSRYRVIRSWEFRMMATDAGASEATAKNLLTEWVQSGKLLQVQQGVYLNTTARPRPTEAEAVATILRGGVISLETALNPKEEVVHVCVPRLEDDSRSRHAPKGMSVALHVLEPSMLRPDISDDLLFSPAPYPKASIEKAIADWVLLGRLAPRGRGAPPVDCVPPGKVRFGALETISASMGIEDEVNRWLDMRDEWEEDQLCARNKTKNGLSTLMLS